MSPNTRGHMQTWPLMQILKLQSLSSQCVCLSAGRLAEMTFLVLCCSLFHFLLPVHSGPFSQCHGNRCLRLTFPQLYIIVILEQRNPGFCKTLWATSLYWLLFFTITWGQLEMIKKPLHHHSITVSEVKSEKALWKFSKWSCWIRWRGSS